MKKSVGILLVCAVILASYGLLVASGVLQMKTIPNESAFPNAKVILNDNFTSISNNMQQGALASGKVWIGQANGTASAYAISGDILISTDGTATIQDVSVAADDIAVAYSNIVIGDAGGTGTAVAVSGDGTLSALGVLTLSGVTTSQTFLSATGVTNTMHITNGTLRVIN